LLPKISFSNFSGKIYLTLKRLDYGRRNMASDEINWFNPANTWDETLGTCGQRKNTVGPLPNWRDAHCGRLQPPEELELLVVGIPDLDFDALEKNTKYEGGVR
jgi:hypothetical protein